MYDLIVLGGSAQGLSTLVSARQIGVENARLIEPTDQVAFPEIVGRERLDVSYGEQIQNIEEGEDCLVIQTDRKTYETRSVVVALNSPSAIPQIPENIQVADRVHAGGDSFTADVTGLDILVVGDNDRAVVLAAKYIREGAQSVVLAARDMNPDLLSNASHDQIAKLEKDRLLTVLYRAKPSSIYTDFEGLPMVDFGDRRLPELQFDHVVFAARQQLLEPEKIGISEAALSSGRLIYSRDPRLDPEFPSATCSQAISKLSQYFSDFDSGALERLISEPRKHSKAQDELRDEFYNATITYFEPTHSDLWVLRVKPDKGEIAHRPGQYNTLALGYWEERIDDAIEPDIDSKWDKLVRRSYSISNRIFDSKGYLASETQDGELEFYIVLVPPTENNVPGLTPRLALKRPGDRIFMGNKVTGRYTLGAVTDPNVNVVFLSTGTGEAPHNSMIVELLRRGHKGKILSAVSVRHLKDLGYLEQHRKLEEMFENYKYLPMPTREPNVPKRYIQQAIESGEIEELLGAPLDPGNTHVYMCGNPSMIGAPEVVDGKEVLPAEPGAVGILLERGFSIDARNQPGNIHFEKYW